MKVLVTGGCGFIGSNLLAYFKKELPEVSIRVLDNLSLGNKKIAADFDVEFFEGDIRDKQIVQKALKNVSAVVHLAAHTRVLDSMQNPEENFQVNAWGTFNLLQSARETGVDRFVFASTGGAIIGESEELPINENKVPRPLSPYGASKLSGEGYCSAFAGSFDMKTVSLRFSNVYGPYSLHKKSVVITFLKNILNQQPLIIYGDGSQTRDYLFVEDLSEVIVKSLQIKKGGEVFQLGSGKETSINELISKIREAIGANFPFEVQYKPFRSGEVRHNYADISKANFILEYRPRISLASGLERTWNWLLKNKSMLNADHVV
jgi:UDP-glucose 4-epimerase